MFVHACIWKCDHPIEMGFAPKDAQFSRNVQRKKALSILVQEMGTFTKKPFPYLRRYEKEWGGKENSVN